MTILNLNNELAVIEISGKDASNYLQGQITNDIQQLTTANQFQLAAHLNPKGRILATFLICLVHEKAYYLITTAEVATKITPRLKMFILRSKVLLQRVEHNIYLSDEAPSNGISLQLAADKFLLITPDKLDSIQNDNLWHKFLIDKTIPLIYLESMEKIIPQQINYDLLGAINFKKGCYTGQEIVARTHYLGKVKRRLVKFSTDLKPEIGQTIVSPLLDDQEVGFIIDYYHENDKYFGLASLQNDCLNSAYLGKESQRAIICQNITPEEGIK